MSSHGVKDSVTFAGEVQEFVWNLVTYELREEMNASSAPSMVPRLVSPLRVLPSQAYVGIYFPCIRPL